MPRDFSKTDMYKIVPKDLAKTDLYIGSTTDIIRRKSMHKSTCNNPNQKGHNLKLYQTIRDNGGWDEWDMVLIERFSCKNGEEARARERQLYEELNPTLNKNRPSITDDERRDSVKDYYIKNIDLPKLYNMQKNLIIRLANINKVLANNTNAGN